MMFFKSKNQIIEELNAEIRAKNIVINSLQEEMQEQYDYYHHTYLKPLGDRIAAQNNKISLLVNKIQQLEFEIEAKDKLIGQDLNGKAMKRLEELSVSHYKLTVKYQEFQRKLKDD